MVFTAFRVKILRVREAAGDLQLQSGEVQTRIPEC